MNKLVTPLGINQDLIMKHLLRMLYSDFQLLDDDRSFGPILDILNENRQCDAIICHRKIFDSIQNSQFIITEPL